MVITEEQLEVLQAHSVLKTVSFEKGDTVFVDKRCQMLTTPLKTYLKSFGAKQVYDINAATYVVARNFKIGKSDWYEFGEGMWYNTKTGVYERHTKKYSTWDRDEMLTKYENHYKYQWDEKVMTATTSAKEYDIEVVLASTVKCIDEASLQSLVYQWHKDNVWQKITPAYKDKLTVLLESSENAHTDMAIKLINKYDPTDIIGLLLLLYISHSTTIYTKQKLLSSVFKKDPVLYDKARNVGTTSYRAERSIGSYDLEVYVPRLSDYISSTDVSEFLGV